MAKLVPIHPVHGDGIFSRITGNTVAARARAETSTLHRQLVQRHRESPYAGPDLIDRLTQHLVELLPRPLPAPLVPAIRQCAHDLIAIETQLFALPDLASSPTALSGMRTRALLRQHLEFFDHQQERVAVWLSALGKSLSRILAALPPLQAGHRTKNTMMVPLMALLENPSELMSEIITDLLPFAPDPTSQNSSVVPGARIGQVLCDELLRASRIGMDVAQRHPERIIFPTAHPGTTDEIFSLYLSSTPYRTLLTAQLPLTVPRKLFTEHTAIFAPSGHGKTQLLQTLIYEFLNEPDPPAMFVVDSQGDMLRKLQVLDFKHRDRLVVLDPDTHPPQLNFLDFKGSNQAATDELFGYLMSSLSRDLTAKQGTAVSYLLRLMRAIPGATIDTLRQVMESKTPHPAIGQLDPLTQDFFRNQFYNSSAMGATRQQIAGRLYTLLSNETFRAMFTAPSNSFDAFKLMQAKKIVLLNTSQLLLRDAAAVLGRYFIAQVLSAAYERVTIPEKDRHLALLIIDEAAQYFDDYTETILSQSRKFGLGLIAATQFVEQMPDRVKAAVAGGTAVKYAGPVSQKDARFLAPEMYTTPEFIRAMKKSNASTEFAVHVRGLTPQAVCLTVPFGTVENAPKCKTRPTASVPSSNVPTAPKPVRIAPASKPTLPDDDPYKATKLT